MPYSPKSFHGCTTGPLSSGRSALLIISSLLIGISGFIFEIATFLRSIPGYCLNSHPRSIRVVWEHSGGGSGGGSSDGNRGIGNRHKVMGFVGIQTGFGSVGRRQALRKTWMPRDRQGHARYTIDLLCYMNVIFVHCHYVFFSTNTCRLTVGH